jgi:hypothetical protein
VTGAALATVKLHRFEIGIALFLLLALTGWATFSVLSAAALNVPSTCFALLGTTSPDAWGACEGPLRAWANAHIGGSDLFRQAIEFIPFAASALVGVPIVAREIEGRTTSTAWSLEPSRTRWLLRQVRPILLVVGLAALALGAAAGAHEHDWDVWGGGRPDIVHIGHYGPGLVARMFGIFGLAVALGALLGRQLPAFLLSFALALGCVNLLATVRDTWFASHPAHVLDEPGWVTGWAWRTPDGALLSPVEAAAAAPPDANSESWLEEHGYVQVALGISSDTAMGWAPYEALAYISLGTISIAGAMWLVIRRRPT